MHPDPRLSPSPSEDQSRSRTARKLIIAAALIGLAVAGLTAVDRLREPSARVAPPHEPAQALITTPAPLVEDRAAQFAQPPGAPLRPQTVNDDALRGPATVPPTQPLPPATRRTVPHGSYLVQAGTFKSMANARALRQQLQRAGIEAHLETRVQLGPFKNKRDANKALAHAKKLGIEAVLIGPY